MNDAQRKHLLKRLADCLAGGLTLDGKPLDARTRRMYEEMRAKLLEASKK